ncbi:FecR family protein [Polaribacter sp. Hel1_85]|uniref:FecR family protein n=1 Tax=Polaribacter sp. Hel1_85 TaxID=1250005 RepID=UPI0005624DBC|nr:FecR domain-containing protein [Polaribacter sp. Hel1_85]
MNTKNIDELIIKFVESKATLEEQVELRNRLEIKENRIYFEEYVELHYLLNSKIKFDYKKPLKGMIGKIQSKSKYNFFKYAASIIVLIATGYFLTKTTFKTVTNESITVGTDKAILTLGDGSRIALEKGKKYKSKKISSDGKKIIYESGSNETEKKIVYNYLTIPRGGQFFIELEDGTKVWLNSESKLKYPVNFSDGERRKVELIYGEAYFDVSSSSKHNGDSFVVQSKMQNVEVLGTEFNIKAYHDETVVLTTLIEGSVALSNSVYKKVIKPGEQSKIFQTNNRFEVYKVDVEDEIGWRNGMFSFTNKPLKEIMVVLSRWYDLEIFITDVEIENVRFTGMLSKKKPISIVLQEIKSAIDMEYSFNNKNLIIKKRE